VIADSVFPQEKQKIESIEEEGSQIEPSFVLPIEPLWILPQDIPEVRIFMPQGGNFRRIST